VVKLQQLQVSWLKLGIISSVASAVKLKRRKELALLHLRLSTSDGSLWGCRHSRQVKLFVSVLQDKSKHQAAKVQYGKKTFLIFSVKRGSRSLGFYSLLKLFPNLMPLHSVLHLIRSLILPLALFLVEVHTWLALQSTGRKTLNNTHSESTTYSAITAFWQSLQYFLVENFTLNCSVALTFPFLLAEVCT